MRMRFVLVGSLVLAAVGAWLILSPSVIGYPSSATFPRWNDVVCGILVVVFGLASAVWRRPGQPFWPTLRQSAPTIAVVAIALYLWVMVFAVYYFRIGRVDAFYQFCVAVTLLILGMAVVASRMAHSQKPSELHGELEQASLSAVRGG